jgi:hypothetical protein
MKNTRQGNKREKKGLKSKQKITSESAKCMLGSPKRRKHETSDLNPSLVASAKKVVTKH